MNDSAPSKIAPWYKHRWPWILMSGPAIVVVAGFVTAWLAVTSFDGLVVDDYYKEGKAINRTLERDVAAQKIQAQANVDFSQPKAVSVTLSLSNTARIPQSLRLSIVHPTLKGQDQTLILTPHHDLGVTLDSPTSRIFVGNIEPMRVGRWSIMVEDDLQTWRLRGRFEMGGVTRQLVLTPHVNL